MPKEILDHLEWIEMKTLDKLKRPNWSVFKGGYQLNARDLGLTSEWVMQWNSYIEILKEDGASVKAYNEKFVCPKNKKIGIITAKLAYEFIAKNWSKLEQRWWYKYLWSGFYLKK